MTALISLMNGIKEKGLLGFLQSQAEARGWPFLASWTQRITGVILVLFVWLHIIFLSGLKNPESFDTKAKILGFFIFTFLEWLLALPVIYHALNGGRIILYELFGVRQDDLVLKWVVALSILYSLLLAPFMILGNQSVSAGFFWTYVFTASLCAVFIVARRVRRSGISFFWKLQRISGAFLFFMIPAHMLFMHLNQTVGHTSQSIIPRMNNPFMKFTYLLLVLAILYHGFYGVWTIIQDYLPSQKRKEGLGLLLSVITVVVTIVVGWVGIKLIIQI